MCVCVTTTTGLLGKRTRFQQDAKMQLVVVQEVYPGAVGRAERDSNAHLQWARTSVAGLRSEHLLEKLDLTETDKGNYNALEGNTFTSVLEEVCTPIQQVLLAAQSEYVMHTHPLGDDITVGEGLAFVEGLMGNAVLPTQSGAALCNAIQRYALVRRSMLELKKNNYRERSLEQLEMLIAELKLSVVCVTNRIRDDAMLDHSGDSEALAGQFAIASQAALQMCYATPMQSVVALQLVLAGAYYSLELRKNAMDIFMHLGRFDGAIDCLVGMHVCVCVCVCV
jgi:hypothetical protein